MEQICKECALPKVKVSSGKKDRYGNTVYVEGLGGRIWKGNRCPSCRYGKKPDNSDLGPDDKNLNPLTSRYCRDCKKQLRMSSYFKCESCHHASVGEGRGCYDAYDWGFGVAGL